VSSASIFEIKTREDLPLRAFDIDDQKVETEGHLIGGGPAGSPLTLPPYQIIRMFWR